MRVATIASSSEGNCIYLAGGEHHFLVDIGISRKRVEAGLQSMGVLPEQITGIFITHEHIDHIKGLEVWMKKNPVMVYATKETFKSMKDKYKTLKDFEDYFRPIAPGETLFLENFCIMPFSISHDAANPVGYTFEKDGKKAGIATDLGIYDQTIIDALSGSRFLLLEANHDPSMLQVGKYPYALKQRILGPYGHLSNEKAGKLAVKLLPSGLQYLLLGHMSKDNNFPELAYETVRYELEQSGYKGLSGVSLDVADRKIPSKLYQL